jgi:hypothetical protein
MDPNLYNRYSKYHTTLNEITYDLDHYIGGQDRKTLFIWLIGLSNIFPKITPYIERCILIFDKIPSAKNFELIYQKVILISTLQLCIKLKGTDDITNNLIDYIKDDISPYLRRKEINMSEIYICNSLGWGFRQDEISVLLDIFMPKISKTFTILNKKDFEKVSSRVLQYGLLYFNTAELPSHTLAVAIMLITFDQFEIPCSRLLPVIKVIKELINYVLETHEVCIYYIKWTKEKLYQYIVSTQEFPIVMRYSEQILNDYRDNFRNNSFEISRRSYIKMIKQLDLHEPYFSSDLSFSEDLGVDLLTLIKHPL